MKTKDLEKMNWSDLCALEEALNVAKVKLEARLKEQFNHNDIVRASHNGKDYEGSIVWRNTKTANLRLQDGTITPPIPWGVLRLVKKAASEKPSEKKSQAEAKTKKPKKPKKAMTPKTEAPIEKTEAPIVGNTQ